MLEIISRNICRNWFISYQKNVKILTIQAKFMLEWSSIYGDDVTGSPALWAYVIWCPVILEQFVGSWDYI